MCGIFGILSSHVMDDNLHVLALENINRGNNGFGLLSICDDLEMVLRSNSSYNKSLFLNINLGNLVCCHLLASTGTEKRIHPFETDRFAFAHNGILTNYLNFPQWYMGPVDSQYILGGIKYFVDKELCTVPEAISYTNQQIEGQRACWLWDKLDKKLYLWRVMSPLYLSVSKTIVFSSSVFEGGDMIEEGVIYSIDYQNHELKQEEEFKFYSYV